MKIRDIMTNCLGFCGPRTNGATLAEVLWSRDCGSIPIVDEKNRIVGIVTDRDLCIALGTRNCRPSDLVAEDVMARDVATCCPDDDVLKALRLMQTRKVRRLPIVDGDRALVGILSIDDVIQRAARTDGASEFSQGAVVSAMAHIVARSFTPKPSLVGV